MAYPGNMLMEQAVGTLRLLEVAGGSGPVYSEIFALSRV